MATTTIPKPRRLVGVSTKMYFSASRTRAFVTELLHQIQLRESAILSKIDLFIIPDHVTLASVVDQVRGTGILVGAQDAHHEDFGAFTGEVSPAVLAEVGCRILEVGHAERRRLFGETDEVTARKAEAAVRNGMAPLVCIGEKEEGDDAGAAAEMCRGQVEAVLGLVPGDAEVIFAYEPVWAIGAAQPASAKHVVGVIEQIRGFEAVRTRTGPTRIIYGGSAGPGLFQLLDGELDGLFLGRFGHDPVQVLKTVEEVAEKP